MKIKSLDISNFRGIKKAKIDFSQSNLAVFIGTNGQGKSSILDLLAIFLNKISDGVLRTDSSDHTYAIKYSDIKNGTDTTQNSILIEHDNTEFIWDERAFINENEKGTGTFDEYDAGLNSIVAHLINRTRANRLSINLPILLYIKANRFLIPAKMRKIRNIKLE
jgi:predicted ATP-binding protein involved in virulence